MRKTISNLLIIGCGSLFISGCSSIPGISDIMGDDKQAPDERQVSVHQMLALPPDYELRPPADGSNIQSPQANPYALPALTPGAAAPTLPTQVATVDPSAPGPTSIAPGAATQPAANTYQGVSTLNPDGTPKSRAQINKELKKKHIEDQRKKNPNYGTIWNIGSLFSDW